MGDQCGAPAGAEALRATSAGPLQATSAGPLRARGLCGPFLVCPVPSNISLSEPRQSAISEYRFENPILRKESFARIIHGYISSKALRDLAV